MGLREFIKRHAVTILLVEFALIVALSISIFSIVTDIRANAKPDLPGLRNEISERSKAQLDSQLQLNAHVLGGWIFLRNYDSKTFPILHYWTRHFIARQFIEDFKRKQTSGTEGIASSAIVSNPNNASFNNAEAAVGFIRCVPTAKSAIAYYTPELPKYARTICIASLPPFETDEKINLQLVTVTDLPVDSPELKDIRKTMMQLQIDIFNRDYRGYETWLTLP